MKPYYEEPGITIYHGDSREILPNLELYSDVPNGDVFVIDPPWDAPGLYPFAYYQSKRYGSRLVFTDSRNVAEALTAFGPPSWLFVWDTMNTWSISPRQPVQQTKLCLWYGDRYDRDAELWGTAPPERNHPTTKQIPLDGRRLTDLYRESLRWLHYPGAGDGSNGSERFGKRVGNNVLRHAKPLGWLRCLIGNTSRGNVIDPFMGSGTSLVAAKELGRRGVGIDIDEACCEFAAKRLAQEVLRLENIP